MVISDTMQGRWARGPAAFLWAVPYSTVHRAAPGGVLPLGTESRPPFGLGWVPSDGRVNPPPMDIIQPAHFPRPRGYVNGTLTSGRLLHIAGQIGWELDGSFANEDFIYQFGRALDHVLDIVRAAGAGPESVASMTIYVCNIQEYRERAVELGSVWRARFGRHYPAMALVGVAALVEPRAKVEIQAVAELN